MNSRRCFLADAMARHLFQPMNSRRCFLADAMARLRHARVLCFVKWNRVLEQLQNALELGVVGAGWVWQATVLGIFFLELFTLVHQQCCITAVVNKQVASVRTWHSHHLLSAPRTP